MNVVLGAVGMQRNFGAVDHHWNSPRPGCWECRPRPPLRKRARPALGADRAWAVGSAFGGERVGTTSSCTPVSTFFSLWPCITTSAPILQSFVFNSSEEEMCQHVPSASVAMPPLFIALRVVFFDAIFVSLNCSRPHPSSRSYHLCGWRAWP